MADLAMCQSNTCSVRSTCRRSPFSGTPVNEYRQTYGTFELDAKYNFERCGEYLLSYAMQRQQAERRKRGPA